MIIFFSYLPRYSAFRKFRVYSGYMESRSELADLTRSNVPTMTESTRIETPRQLNQRRVIKMFINWRILAIISNVMIK
jgi:hypothetical protein